LARKSRKQDGHGIPPRYKPNILQAAAYVRLSVNERNGKSDSINTQQNSIASYIDEHPEIELYDTYIDSGVSGTTLERPGFLRLLNDIEAGKINCVIIKDE
jgi:DNA invertase Pin-like site-specific DNA recombinase